MYTQYFGLRENPFALAPDPRYLYLSLRHQEALAHLMFGITQGGGFVQLTGEVGTGKTMMVRALLERLPDNIDVALVLYPFLSVEEFIAAICDDLRVPRPEKGGVKTLIDALNQYLLANHAKGRRTVLVIDEAQNLSHEVLEQVRLLTNLETTKEKLLQILLVGQPELNSLLAQQELRQLAQRITAHYNLKSLLPRETAEYVLHRLRVARARTPLFTRSALSSIHRLSSGTPRLINILADRALLGAYARGKNRVTAGIVRQAAAEIGRPPRTQYALIGGAAAALVAGVSFASWQFIARDTAPAEPAPIVAAVAPTPTEAAVVAVVNDTDAAPTRSLESFLRDSSGVFNTDTALAALFAQWRKDYERFPGKTGCERALSAGLRCAYASGNWNNLRQLNRPAVIELMDTDSQRHHVLVSGLKNDKVVLDLAGQTHEFPLAEVDRYWFGKFLVLWTPPPSGEQTLRRGMRGPGVAWLREALARYEGHAANSKSDVFDAGLEEEVKAFQRKHQLADDGIVGRFTLIQLDGYDASGAPPLLTKSTTTDPS
mgnify:CR=1 FL=1